MNLNKSQYKTLLMMMYCGEFVINGHNTKKDIIQFETENLEQYIFSFAKEYGFEKFIEYDKNLKMYFPTADMEDEFHGFIDRYDLNQKRK